VPAVLGCIESALEELMWAAAALEQTSADLVEQNAHDDPRIAAIAERMHRGFANLQRVRSDGERAPAPARSLAGRAFTASGAASPDRRRRQSTT
jgi:hypothetical protein